MAVPAPSGQPTDLNEVRARFETFRATRQHGTRIPSELYRAAIDLLDRYSENQICGELQLDPERFRRRRATLSQGPRVKRQKPSKRQPRPEPTRFVEVPLAMPAPGREVRVQIERADGLRLTVSVGADEWLRIEALARQLFEPQ